MTFFRRPIPAQKRLERVCVCILLNLALGLSLQPQITPTQSPSQAPKTSPQVQQVLPSYQGQNVSFVELAGQPEVDTRRLLPLLEQRAGEPFSQAKVDASIAALKRTGQFEDVQLEVRPETRGVRVLFVLQPAIYFGIFEFPGADRLSYARLLQVTNYPPRGEYTQSDVDRAQLHLETFLRRLGFFRVEVRPELEMHPQQGLVDVIFHVTLNRRAKFGEVSISGTTPAETQYLENAVHSTMARLRLSAIRTGKTYKLKTLQNATHYLESRLSRVENAAPSHHAGLS